MIPIMLGDSEGGNCSQLPATKLLREMNLFQLKRKTPDRLLGDVGAKQVKERGLDIYLMQIDLTELYRIRSRANERGVSERLMSATQPVSTGLGRVITIAPKWCF